MRAAAAANAINALRIVRSPWIELRLIAIKRRCTSLK